MIGKEQIALVLLRNGDQVLLVREDYGDHLWTLPGGVVEPGETIVDAAVRELREETGLAGRVTGLVALRDRPDQTLIVLSALPLGGRLLSAVPGEIAATAWFDHGEVVALGDALYDVIYAILRRAFQMPSPNLPWQSWMGYAGPHANLFH